MTRAPRRKSVRRKRPLERIGMGDLISLSLELPDGRRRTWRFRERPVLSFDYVSPDAKGHGRQARLFVDCGHYRVTDDDRLVVEKGTNAEARAKVSKTTADRFRLTHGGLAGRVTLACPLRPAGRKRFVGWCKQLDYRADKGRGGEHFYHPVEKDCRPEVWVSRSGRSIYFKGGRYTVTPHGIEDLEG